MAEISEKFLTKSDRIKDYLLKNPDDSFGQCYEYIWQTFGIAIRQGLFYKIRHDIKLNLVSHQSAEDCYRDLVKIAHEEGFDILTVIETLLSHYNCNTIKEQIRIILNIKKYPSV